MYVWRCFFLVRGSAAASTASGTSTPRRPAPLLKPPTSPTRRYTTAAVDKRDRTRSGTCCTATSTTNAYRPLRTPPPAARAAPARGAAPRVPARREEGGVSMHSAIALDAAKKKIAGDGLV
ncbi:hypothetical protein C8R45DRAFT_1047326 [Mycena sanguinolenta]|nr:hypothetical protein C8R45DRAFT_1047326 [Mycena sanguinolenta]